MKSVKVESLSSPRKRGSTLKEAMSRQTALLLDASFRWHDMLKKLPLLLLLLISGTAFAEDKMTLKKEGGLDIPAKFRTCHADSDCVAAEDVCSRWNWHPINKASAAAAESLYNGATVNCESGNYPKPLVGCVAGSCAIIPDAGECIFHVAAPANACRVTCGAKDANGVCLLPDEQP